MADWKERLEKARETAGNAAQGAGDIARRQAEKAAHAARDAGERIRAAASHTYARTTDVASSAADRAGDAYRSQLGEDAVQVLDQSPIARAMLGQREGFEADPQTLAPLYNLNIRPLVTGAALAGIGGGTLVFDEFLSRFTRSIFDGKGLLGGILQDKIAGLVGAGTVTAVNRYIDMVPGSGVMGGGWLHRIQHGHDLNAVADIWAEHGSGGAIQALYHIYGRDFFTPAGVPILPTGSDAVQQYLVEQLDMSPRSAADLISINAVELLAGVLAFAGGIRLFLAARAMWEDAKVRRLAREAEEAIAEQDFLRASDLIERAVVQRPGDATFQFVRARIYHRAGRQIDAHESYRQTVRLLQQRDVLLDVGGAAISFAGIAATASLATSDAIVRTPENQLEWSERVQQMARTGVGAFERTANGLLDRRVIKQLGGRSVLPPRYVSAALNYWLAGQLAGSSLLLPDRAPIMERAARRLDECLEEATKRGLLDRRRDEVVFLRNFAAVQLGTQALAPG